MLSLTQFKNPKPEKQVLLPKSRGLPIPNDVSLHSTQKQYVDSLPYSDYATMTHAVSQLECSFSQPSNCGAKHHLSSQKVR